jgi:hypothetical protein
MAASRPTDNVRVLRQEIEQAREQLGETVERLVAKTDVKARARDQAAALAAKAVDGTRERRVELRAAAGVLVAVGVALWWRRRR